VPKKQNLKIWLTVKCTGQKKLLHKGFVQQFFKNQPYALPRASTGTPASGRIFSDDRLLPCRVSGQEKQKVAAKQQ
jgi:hypothetical protein